MRQLLILWAISTLFMLTPQDSFAQASEEAQIKSSTRAFEEAYNQHNVNKAASLWDEEAVYQHPLTGERFEGRQAIAEHYKKRFSETDAPRISMEVKQVEFTQADKALVSGALRVTVKDKPAEQGIYKAEYVKKGGKWLLASVSEVELEPAPTYYEHLKELEWLVGKWIDQDENTTILLNWQWGSNKNYLLQQFSMKVLDQNILDGQQIVTWDPIKQQIRSWIFDSDGGFGEGFWTPTENSWSVEMVFTLADGRRASATHIYAKVDAKTYTFASKNREVGGEVLPDLEPVKVVSLQGGT